MTSYVNPADVFFTAPPSFDVAAYAAQVAAMDDKALYDECSYQIWSAALDNAHSLWGQDAKDTDARCGLLLNESYRRPTNVYSRAHAALVREAAR